MFVCTSEICLFTICLFKEFVTIFSFYEVTLVTLMQQKINVNLIRTITFFNVSVVPKVTCGVLF